MPTKRKPTSKKTETKSIAPFTEYTRPRVTEHQSPTRPYVTAQNFASAQTTQRQSFSEQYNRVPNQTQHVVAEPHVEHERIELSRRRRGRTPKQTLYMFMGLTTGALVVLVSLTLYVIPSTNVAAVMPAVTETQNDQKDIAQMTPEEKAQYEAAVAEAAARYVTLVSSHILLEPDDVPEVIKVTDAQQVIAKDSLFKGVQEGDVVLMFQKSQKAVIYSPARDRIVNVVPLGGVQEDEIGSGQPVE